MIHAGVTYWIDTSFCETQIQVVDSQTGEIVEEIEAPVPLIARKQAEKLITDAGAYFKHHYPEEVK